MKVPAEELGWNLTLGREGLSGLPHHKKPAPNGFGEGWSIYPLSSMAASILVYGFVRGTWQIERRPDRAILVIEPFEI